MPVNLPPFPDMPPITGVKLNAVNAGIKNTKQLDAVLISMPAMATVAGVFTQNAFCAAPVTLCKQHMAACKENNIALRYLLINSGNANACTGDQGFQDAYISCEAVARYGAVEARQVLPFSTGVIGERLPVDKLTKAIPSLVNNLSEQNWLLAAQGVMTTDTQPKGATRQFEYQGETIVVNGISKGAGMINPDMATMLGFVATNASVTQSIVETLSFNAAQQSFNRITIDGDTSTNDSCILIASGETSIHIDSTEHELYRLLEAAVFEVYHELAQAIVRDGEGATKFVTVEVNEGENPNECLRIAYAIAHSPLVKTALFASDPNWGRIVAAIGYAGVKSIDASQIRVYLGDVLIVENGGRAASYTETAGQKVMNQQEITVRVFLGRGESSETLWTSDLSHEYVTINAEYRT